MIFSKNKIMFGFIFLFFIGCTEKNKIDMNASIEGELLDEKGDLLYGDLNGDNLVINLLGELDFQPIKIRVNGEGRFKNTKLFPQRYKSWVSGPVLSVDTNLIDINKKGLEVKTDFVVVPLCKPSIKNATLASTEVIVDFSINDIRSNIESVQLYLSNVPFPSNTIGNLNGFYFTQVKELDKNIDENVVYSMQTSIDADQINFIRQMKPLEQIYVRMGVETKASSLRCFSNQVVIDVPE